MANMVMAGEEYATVNHDVLGLTKSCWASGGGCRVVGGEWMRGDGWNRERSAADERDL